MKFELQSVKERTINKGKRGINQVIFGRTTIVLGSILVQLLLLLLYMTYLAQHIYVFFGGYLTFGALISIMIMNRTTNPGFQLSWVLLIMLFPIVGGLFYLYVEFQPTTFFLKKSLETMDLKTKGIPVQKQETVEALRTENENTAHLAEYLYYQEEFPVYPNTGVTYFESGEKKFEELVSQLKKARTYIFLEYFILAEGIFWDTIHEVLKAKVQEGVEVRLLYDGMNDLNNLPDDFQATLKREGIQCKVFSKVYPVISTHYNNRDHRKIAVIDGRIAFTGGVNLADEYINQKKRFGHWKDAAVMLQGEAVQSFLLMFLKMWNLIEPCEDIRGFLEKADPIEKQLTDAGKEAAELQKEELAADPPKETQPETGDAPQSLIPSRGYVIPYATNPFHGERIAERVYMDILNHARHYVHIMTPYLVPDYEMLQALIYAAKRGVDVKLILPHIPDKKYAFALAHSYYSDLLESGVKIYEYTPGFVHSKVFVSDNRKAVVGTINLDYRSLYLNFECAVYLYEVAAIEDIEADFRRTLPECHLVTAFDIRHDRLLRKVAGALLKPLAPLM